MREGWELRKIADIVEPVSTIDPRKMPGADFTYIDVSAVSRQSHEVVETSLIRGKDAPSRARRLVRAGDVIFATIRPTLQRIAEIPPALDGAVCSTGYFVLRPKARVLTRFLFYSLFSERFSKKIAGLQRGAAYPAVSDADVKAREILVPPLPEQKRIVAILDEAFAGIATAVANTEKNLANARRLFESYLNAVFSQRGEGWTESPLETLVTDSCTLSYGIVQPGSDVRGGIPVVRPTDLRQKLIRRDTLKTIDPSLAKAYSRTTLHGGDLLLCVRGTTGDLSVAATELEGANVTRGIVPIRFNPSLLNQELGYHLLRSPFVQDQIAEKTYGAALMQINIKDVRKLLVLVPPHETHEELCSCLNDFSAETDQLQSIYGQKHNALSELKKSLLQKAFSGELTAGKAAADAMRQVEEIA